MPVLEPNLPEDEQHFKEWLTGHPSEVLQEVGLRRGHQVLDYGCGDGAFAMPAAEIVAPGLVYAADVDGELLARLRTRAEDRHIRNLVTVRISANTSFTLLGGRPFDAVLLYDVLQLIDDRVGLLERLCGVLKPGGIVSVFPMHIGTERMLQIAEQTGMLKLRDHVGMILNFSAGKAEIQADANEQGTEMEDRSR